MDPRDHELQQAHQLPTTTGASPQPLSKLPRACERCWKRKQKCDRLAPVCSACKENKVDCRPRVVMVDVEALPKDPNKPIIQLSGYVDSLKRKTEVLRNSLQRKRPKPNHSPDVVPTTSSPEVRVSAHLGSTALSPMSARSNSSVTHPTQTPRDEEDDGSVHAAMGEIGYLSLSAMAEPRITSANVTQPLSLRTILKAAGSVDGGEPYRSILPNIEANSRRGRVDLVTDALSITREMTLEFVQRFVDHVSSKLAPTLSQTKVFEYYNKILSDNDAIHKVGSVADLQVLVAYTIIAVGILLSPEAVEFKSLASKLHASALELLPNPLEHTDSIVTLHLQIILTVYSMYCPTGGSTWHLIGVTARRSIALGYHREPDARQQLTQEEIDSRRWLFWSIYIIERTIAVAMDRPFSMQDEEITVKLPNRRGTSSDAFNHHILSHARLVSSMRTPRENSLLFDWYNLSFWSGSTPNFDPSQSRSGHSLLHFQQLSSRAMSLLCDWTSLEDLQIRTMNGVPIYIKVQQCTASYVRALHDVLDEESVAFSFIDAYDVFSMGVIYLAISCMVGGSTNITETTEIISKCSTLLTLLCQQFRPLNIIRKVLWTFHDLVMRRGSLSGSTGDMWITVPSILEELPSAVPFRIGRVIKQVCQARSPS